MLAFRGRDRRGRKDPLDRGWAAIDLLFKKRSYGGSMVQWGVAQRRNVASCILSPFPVLCKVAHMGRIGLPELLIVLAILVVGSAVACAHSHRSLIAERKHEPRGLHSWNRASGKPGRGSTVGLNCRNLEPRIHRTGGPMSARNGDKARFHLKRKAKIQRRIRLREWKKALREKAAQAEAAQSS